VNHSDSTRVPFYLTTSSARSPAKAYVGCLSRLCRARQYRLVRPGVGVGAMPVPLLGAKRARTRMFTHPLPMEDMRRCMFYSPLGRYGFASPDFAARFRRFMITIAESAEGITSTKSKPSSAAFCSLICASSVSLNG